ncbi:MAG: transketolase [Phycisphaeraceae bacterium]|nr:transketolase [Phycisphaeraceae bacterium]
MSFESTVHAKAVDLAKFSYEMTAEAGSGHPTTAASLAHLTAVLMYTHMRWEPANPLHPSSDRFVLSEGHAVPIVYAAAADLGVMIGKDRDSWRAMDRSDAMSLRAIDSPIDGHPNPMEGFPFFDAATGSLGQGLSIAAGLGAAAKVDGLDKRIFCIIGDGESREGQIWEAIDFIRDHALNTVCPIFNCNVYAQSDEVSPQQTADALIAKLEAAGFRALDIDGHDPAAIRDALAAHADAADGGDAPVAIVARTVKGWGSPSQQGHGHNGKPADGDDLQKALEELDATGREVGATADTPLEIPAISGAKPDAPRVDKPMSFAEALEAFGKGSVLKDGEFPTRKAYGVALQALGRGREDVVALDADVKNSTYAIDFYEDESLKSRFFECRIAEQNMFSAAAGLSAGGKIPFASTFAKFVTRGYDQIEMAIFSGANLKVVGSHAGITLAADGPSQMSLPDIAWFRSLGTATNHNGDPACYLIQPSDAWQAYDLTMKMAEHNGACYMRTLRPSVEFLYGPDDTFELGGHEVLTEGEDLLIATSGYMVHEANRALDKLDEAGIDATLVDLYSLPFDQEAILDLAHANNGMVLTIEDNFGGGFGSAVADAISGDGGGFQVEQMTVSRIPKSGRSPEAVLDYCGLSADHIVERAKKLMSLATA